MSTTDDRNKDSRPEKTPDKYHVTLLIKPDVSTSMVPRLTILPEEAKEFMEKWGDEMKEFLDKYGEEDPSDIRALDDSFREAFYSLAEEYLPDSDYDKVKMREERYRSAYLGVFAEKQLIGVAFGWPRCLDDPADDSFCLNGIAVRAEFQQQGYGSWLLEEFTQVASAFGFNSVSVGSAGGYVEHFYIENGFMPKQYKYYDEDGIRIEKEFSDMEEYENYARIHQDGFVVMEYRM